MICDECETVAHCMKNGCVPKTTKKDEALRLALEALTHGCPPDCKDGMTDSGGIHPWGEAALVPCPNCEAITALREALNASLAEQPAPPPECQTEAEKTAFAFGWFKALESVRQQPAQRTWVGLTDDEKKNIFLKWYGKHWAYTKQVQAVMDSVEAKLKEKNCD